MGEVRNSQQAGVKERGRLSTGGSLPKMDGGCPKCRIQFILWWDRHWVKGRQEEVTTAAMTNQRNPYRSLAKKW